MRSIRFLFYLAPSLLLAQQPAISSISPTSLQFGETVTITGNNLTGGSARVFFGSIESSNVQTSGSNLLAEVPAGATQGPITVLNNNLVAQSPQPFYVSFGGEGAPTLGAQNVIEITDSDARNVFEICLCDINADGLNDVVVTHENFDGTEDGLAEYSYFINTTTTSSTTSFGAPVTINLGGSFSNVDGFVSVECADLDNDGNHEFIFIGSESLTEPIFLFNDITSGTSTSQLGLPRTPEDDVRNPRGVEVSDVNGDGLLDIIVGNGTDNVLHIYLNRGSLSFDDAMEITVDGAPETESIAVGDLNNDLLPDIAIVPFGSSNESIYLLRNNSTSSAVSFIQQAAVESPGQRRNIRIGDFNNDGLSDLATTTNGANEEVQIFENNSTIGGNLSFNLVEEIVVPTDIIWGIDLGDINGDGLLDVAVSCVGSGGSGEVYAIENTTSTAITFADPIAGSIAENSRNIAVGDLNGDAKPDLAYTHKVTQGEDDGELGFNINETCISPVITPRSFTYCSGDDFVLKTTNTPNGTYSWSGITPISTSGNTATFNIVGSDPEVIEVEITQGGCTTTEQITVEFAAGSTPGAPTIEVNDANGGVSLCEGEAVTLSTSTSFANYLWTLPDGSTSTSSSIEITEVEARDAGQYRLSIRDGGCSSPEGIADLSIEILEAPIIGVDGDLIFCDDNTGDEPSLEIEDRGNMYQWRLDGANLSGSTGTSITADQSGDYTVLTTNGNGCTKESGPITIRAVAPPSSAITGISEICRNLSTMFMAASTGESGFTLEYSWRVDSAGVTLATSSDADFDYTFTSPTTFDYNVVLTTNYSGDEVASCADEETLVVTVSPPPAISFNVADEVQKCGAESIDISITNTGVDTYNWSRVNAHNDVDTLFDANVSGASTLNLSFPVGIDSMYAVIEILTTIGCTTRDSILVKNFPSDIDISSPDFSTILEFDSASLEEAISISLDAVNIVSDFSWEPADQIDNPTASSITFFPQIPESTVTLTGVDGDGCLVSTAVLVELENFRPKKTFSPNGDGTNDCWEILNIGDLGSTADNSCEVYVFDSRGRNVKVFSEFVAGDNCVWDGTFSGSPVPEGVYYFVLKCSNDSFSQSGSILLAR